VAVPADETARYDLVHVRPRPWQDGQPRTASLLQLDFDFAGSALPLDEARAQRRAHDRHGITTLIVPARYRTAEVTLADATRAAWAAARAAGPGPRPEPPRFHADHPMFFTFLVPAAEPEAAAAGSGPGLLVSVDKCDGHIWSDEEMGEFFALVGPR
jgi:hypothetical protein